ncbi:MAG: hypothetical protein ACEROO_07690, partial [Candidatus Bathyarchaeota archaeon]
LKSGVTSAQSVRGMVVVLARGGKVLNDLSNMGYVAPELAAWVGAPLAEAPQEVLGGPERLAITKKTPSQGAVQQRRGLPGSTTKYHQQPGSTT